MLIRNPAVDDIYNCVPEYPLIGSMSLDRMDCENFLLNLKTWKFEFSSQVAHIEFNAIRFEFNVSTRL